MSVKAQLHGPDWEDVRGYLESLHDRGYGLPVVRLTPVEKRDRELGFYVEVVFVEADGRVKSGLPRAWGAWPDSRHKTLEGLVFRICYNLDAMLEERADKAAKQAAF